MKALDKTMSVLELFTPANPQWGLFELSEATSLPVSTLHRIVSVLKRHGLMIQDPESKKYRLGYAAIELGRRAAAGLPVRQMAEGTAVETFARAVDSAAPGDVTGPVRVGDAFWILVLRERGASTLPSFESSKGQLAARVQTDMFLRARSKWLEGLRRREHVRIRF